MTPDLEVRTIEAARRWLAEPGGATERTLGACLERLFGARLAGTDWWGRYARVDGFLLDVVQAEDAGLVVTGRAVYEDGRHGWWCAAARAVVPVRDDAPGGCVLQFGDAGREDEPYGIRRRPAPAPTAWRATFAPQSAR